MGGIAASRKAKKRRKKEKRQREAEEKADKKLQKRRKAIAAFERGSLLGGTGVAARSPGTFLG